MEYNSRVIRKANNKKINDHDLRLQLTGRAVMSDFVVMELLSSEYGWTPREIGNLTMEEITAYLQIINMKREIQNEEQKKQRNKLK